MAMVFTRSRMRAELAVVVVRRIGHRARGLAVQQLSQIGSERCQRQKQRGRIRGERGNQQQQSERRLGTDRAAHAGQRRGNGGKEQPDGHEHTQRSGDRGSGERDPGKPGGERQIVGGDVGGEVAAQSTRSLNSSSVSPVSQ